MNLEAVGTDPLAIIAQFILALEKGKLKYSFDTEEAYSITIEVPPREDPCNEAGEDDAPILAQVQLLKNPGAKDSFLLNFKRVQGDFFSVNEFYQKCYKTHYEKDYP